MFRTKALAAAIAVCSAAAAFPWHAVAQDFPNRLVRIIQPLAPGSTPDTMVRTMLPVMAKSLGQPVIAENRTGASGMIAFEYVAKQVPADGYTVLVTNASLQTARAFVKDLRFDPTTDLPAVCYLATNYVMLGSNPDLPFKTFAEMIAYAKQNPGKVHFATSGVYTTLTLFAEAINVAYGTKIVPVPYKGGSPEYMPAVLSGQVAMSMFQDSQIKTSNGRLRPLAISGPVRVAAFPDIPTFTEVKVPEIIGVDYISHVPKGTPKVAMDKLHAAFIAALQADEVKAFLTKFGFIVVGSSQADAEKRHQEMTRTFQEVARKVGIQPE